MRTLILLAAVVGALCAAPLNAQDAAPATSASSSTALVPAYNLSKEVKIQGTIQKIDVASPTGPMGTHVLIQTAQGVVDAHLGYGPAAKPAYLGITEGLNITVVGMMENFEGSEILITRLLQTPTRIFILRNEHGIPIRAVPRGASPASKSQEGGI